MHGLQRQRRVAFGGEAEERQKFFPAFCQTMAQAGKLLGALNWVANCYVYVFTFFFCDASIAGPASFDAL